VAEPSAVDGGRPYGGRLPEERRAERRRRLLDAALQLYGTTGYRATSVAQLCREARVAPAKFYEEFASSEALLIALAADVWAPVRRAVVDALSASAPSIEDMTRAAVSAYCHGLLDDPRRARVLCLEFRGISPEAEAARREQVGQFAQLSVAAFRMLSDGRPRRVLDDRQLAMLSTAMVGAIDEAMRHWLYEPEPRSPVDDIVEMVMTVYVAVGTYLARGPDPG
jgi:AcrR family transcriptional regulator